MTFRLQLFLILGTLVLLTVIYIFLKKSLLTVKYSLAWLGLSLALLIFAIWPYCVYVIRDLLDMVMPSNVIFLLLFGFVLLVLLSLSVAVSQLATKNKTLTQANALLEKRERELEKRLFKE